MQTVKQNPKLKCLLKNVGIGSYNFKSSINSGVNKEVLTDDKMRSLFGASYNKIVYFNFDTGVWNRPNYLGFTIGDQRVDTNNALEMCKKIEQDPKMAKYELVASVTMATSDNQYPGTGRCANNVDYKLASNIVGTLILRDRETGCILSMIPGWMGVDQFEKRSVAAFYGADAMAYKLANNSHLRLNFVSYILNQIQK